MNRILIVLIAFVAVGIGFLGGMFWQQQMYQDACLDMGGGINPDGYPICVVEKPVSASTTVTTSSRKTITYACGRKASIAATFIDTDFVAIRLLREGQPTLSFSAILAPSGSGARYVSGVGSYSFWTKGNDCMVLQGEKILVESCTTQPRK